MPLQLAFEQSRLSWPKIYIRLASYADILLALHRDEPKNIFVGRTEGCSAENNRTRMKHK